MNVVKNIEQYNAEYIYFCEPIKNTIMNEGMFIRILYSTPHFILNGVNLFLPLNDVTIEKYYNKFKCSFQINQNKILTEQIKNIEESILKRINSKNKTTYYKISDQMKSGNIKIFSENIDISLNNNFPKLFMLKISGIWETETHIGLTYKFLKINQF